jgi:uncharacterized membrane protein YciS (DUF1049 family)
MLFDQFKETISHLLNSPKIALAVPATTALVAQFSLDSIIAKIAACVGLCISVLIMCHWAIRNRIDFLELKAMIKESEREK